MRTPSTETSIVAVRLSIKVVGATRFPSNDIKVWFMSYDTTWTAVRATVTRALGAVCKASWTASSAGAAFALAVHESSAHANAVSFDARKE
jgi:hypothetical protein